MSKYTPNSFQVTNAFVDEAMNKISDPAVKIYLIINRKTRGWNKQKDALSIKQLEELSGKSHPTVVKCTKELIKVGLVKLHKKSVHGNVFSLTDNYDIGTLINFPGKGSILIQKFTLFKGQLVKTFNYQKLRPKKSNRGRKSKKPRLNFPQKSNLLVKTFNYLENPSQLKRLTPASKSVLPLPVKAFNTQNTLSKHTNQNKKKNWLDLENLKSQIVCVNNSIDTDEIFKSTWFQRELSAFEGFNQDKNHSDEMMNYFFVDWLLRAYAKYAKQKTQVTRFHENSAKNTKSDSDSEQPQLTGKQVFNFANRLAHHPEISGKYGEPGESYEQLASRLALKLSDPSQVQKLMPYLEQVGFKRKGAAA
ncbi:replication protein [Acinetobacter dispersus]|uniref:Uncharacterized protein n=1 Tax=Acinetobacter dispersus TaxID=70348 RepID=N9N3C6_9GAMM|nr:replication protein [Acinetobacter dispersus]ENW97366.1 hypothetical protein F904_00204 [Acinetobacter dispersus]